MNDKNIFWPWALKNCCVILVWATLAVVFDKWWIALFAVLFMSGMQTRYKTYRVCDGCGKHSPYADNYNEALEKAKESGWIHHVDGNKDYCPECQKNLRRF